MIKRFGESIQIYGQGLGEDHYYYHRNKSHLILEEGLLLKKVCAYHLVFS